MTDEVRDVPMPTATTINQALNQNDRMVELLRQAQIAIGQLISASMIVGNGRYAALQSKQNQAHDVAVAIRNELQQTHE